MDLSVINSACLVIHECFVMSHAQFIIDRVHSNLVVEQIQKNT